MMTKTKMKMKKRNEEIKMHFEQINHVIKVHLTPSNLLAKLLKLLIPLLLKSI